MKIKRIIYTTLLIIWMIVIFMFSNQGGNKSKSTSDKVTSTIIDKMEVVTKQDVTKEEKHSLIEDTRVFVRKFAHFFLYFVLGVFSCLTFRSYGINKNILVYSILFCFVYACSDEVHQMFSDGRTFKFLDIFIDTIASTTSNFICLYFIKR